MAYIIDNYNQQDQWDREHSLYVTYVNESAIAIKQVELEWGLPQLPIRVDRKQHPEIYYVYDTYEDALQYIKLIKALNP